jgi:hypothetical protein
MSLQNTEDRYDYDKLEIKSVTKQFTDHLRELMIDTEKRNNLLSKLPRHILSSTKVSQKRICLDNTVGHVSLLKGYLY